MRRKRCGRKRQKVRPRERKMEGEGQALLVKRGSNELRNGDLVESEDGLRDFVARDGDLLGGEELGNFVFRPVRHASMFLVKVLKR